MRTLAAALALAQRGFSVFPLKEHGKEPVFNDWPSAATTDEQTIRSLWTDPVLRTEHNYNIGILCTDIVVIDIDVKNDKKGYEEYTQLNGHYDTLVVQTPTGGVHCFFNGPDSSNSSLANGIDVRSHNGYVVGPGSFIPGYGTEHYTIINDRPMAWVPETIERMLKPAYNRSELEPNAILDSQSSIEAGKRYLETAPLAIEGQRGDETTFIIAARLCREMALSIPAAFYLMRDHWNDRCVPPWPYEELLRKVENAAAYGTADLGKLTPEALFGHLVIPPQPTIFDQLQNPWGNAILPDRIPPRPWLLDRVLMKKAVTLLLAAGSAGKSSLSLALAAHLALGKNFAGYETRHACKTIVYNGEDDIQEQSRRLLAVCTVYQFDYEEVKKKIMLLSPRQIKMTLVDYDFRKAVRNDALISHLIQECSDPEIGLLILDPLVKIHKCDESNNVQMDTVMETLTDIAHASNISILALHHTAKSSVTQADRVGNMDVSRGASAIVNACRIAFTMFNATKEDAEDYGFNDRDRGQWVRFDDAKMNLALSNDNATWFRKEGIRLYSGDVVGVMKYAELEKSSMHMRLKIGRLLIGTMTANGAGSMLLHQAVATIKAEEPLWSNHTDIAIRRSIEGMFSVSTPIDGRLIKVHRDLTDKKSEKVIITLT